MFASKKPPERKAHNHESREDPEGPPVPNPHCHGHSYHKQPSAPLRHPCPAPSPPVPGECQEHRGERREDWQKRGALRKSKYRIQPQVDKRGVDLEVAAVSPFVHERDPVPECAKENE